LQASEIEISKLDHYLKKSIEISQNIHKSWQLGTLEEKRKIQKLVFPEGIVVDTTKRTYLTSKVNSLFLAKSQFKRTSGGINKKLPIKSDEESSLVAGVVLLFRLRRIRECHFGDALLNKALVHYFNSDLFPFMAFQASLRP